MSLDPHRCQHRPRSHSCNRFRQSWHNVIGTVEATAPEETIITAREGIAERRGRLDVLVNCAGFAHIGSIEETTDKESKYQSDVNGSGLLNFTRGELPVMRKQKSGVMVNMSSITNLAVGEGASLYAGPKLAVKGCVLHHSRASCGGGAGLLQNELPGLAGWGSSNLSRRIEDYTDSNLTLPSRHGRRNGDLEN